MIDVYLPFDKVMVGLNHRNSPGHTVNAVNYDIVVWLDVNAPSWEWGFKGEEVMFRFQDSETAMLFKLTWGGN